MVMKYTMDKSIKECVPKTEKAKEFLEYVKANYTKIDKAEMITYLKLLTTTMYDEVGGVRDHIIKLKRYFNRVIVIRCCLHTLTYEEFDFCIYFG